jgi:LPXTG-motif cell wall-anchored protein
MKRSISLLVTGAMSLGTVALISAVAPGIAAAGGCGTTTIDSQAEFNATFSTSETRATGHNDVVDKGLRVWTEGSSSTDKAAAYMGTGGGFPLADQTAQSNYALTLTNPSGGGVPGYQLVVDFDHDGTDDGILISETAYGDDWWLSNSAKQFVKDGAPNTGGGSGSNWFGTLDEWSAKFPDAAITSFGYSLGSGVKGDVLISSIKFGCNVFAFDLANRAPDANIRVDDSTDSDYRTFWVSGTTSTDPDGDGLTYSWSTPGGTPSSNNVSEYKVTYPNGPGSYTVTLTVTDPSGETNTETVTITVTPPSETVGGGALPNTGANVLGLAAVGGLVLAGGGAGLVATRRRTTGAHSA